MTGQQQQQHFCIYRPYGSASYAIGKNISPTVTAKIVIFSGYAVGTLLAGFLSDYMGRKAAISFFSQLLFGSGIIATVMPNVTGFIAVWFFVGKYQNILARPN